MKRNFLVPIGVVVGLVAMASWSFAGDFHNGVSLKCSDCHVMHFSQQHDYSTNGTTFFTPLGGSGPYTYLLRNDINDLCLSCHDMQSFAPDVFEDHANGYVRQAGALGEDGGNGNYPDVTGHTLNSTDVAPGGTWNNDEGLTCVDCHSAHGGNLSGNSYRNLGGFGTAVGSGTWISYSRGDVEGSNDLGTWVYEDASGGTNNAHYGVGSITFNEPDPTTSAYAGFCKGCHTDFHGLVGGPELGGIGVPPEDFVRHPTAGVEIGAIGGGHSNSGVFTGHVNQVQVMSPLGQRAGAYDGTDTGLTPSCFSCHKGHGNQNAFGLIYMVGTGTIDEEGDDGNSARDACKQCHVQG